MRRRFTRHSNELKDDPLNRQPKIEPSLIESPFPDVRIFSIRDALLLLSMIAICIAVIVVLWMRPPKFLSFDARPITSSKSFPRELRAKNMLDMEKFDVVAEPNEKLEKTSNEKIEKTSPAPLPRPTPTIPVKKNEIELQNPSVSEPPVP